MARVIVGVNNNSVLTPLKPGSIQTISSDNLTITPNTGVTFETSDVGRYLCIRDNQTANGDARRTYRRIASVNTANNTATMEFPFGVSPFRAETSLRPANTAGVTDENRRLIEVAPDAGDTFVLSRSIAEVSDALDEIIDVDGLGRYYKIREFGAPNATYGTVNTRINGSYTLLADCGNINLTGVTFSNATDFIPSGIRMTFPIDSAATSLVVELTDNIDITSGTGTIYPNQYTIISGALEDQTTVDPFTEVTTPADVILALEGFAMHAEDVTFEFNYERRLNNRFGSFFIFGNVQFGDVDNPDINGYPTNPCALIDTSGDFSSSSGTILNNGRGVWHQYGGSYEVPTTTFLRLYRDGSAFSDARHDFRMIDVARSGNFGCRLSGERSIVLGGSSRGGTTDSNIIYFNPIAPAVLSNDNIQGTWQAAYHFPQFAGNVTYPATSIQDINTASQNRIIRGDHTVPNGNFALTLDNWSIDELIRESTPSTTDLYVAEGGTSNQQLFIDKTLNFTTSVLGRDSSLQAASVNGLLRPNAGSNGQDTPFTQSITVTDGVASGNVFNSTLRAYTFLVNNTVANFEDTDAVNFTPYQYVFKARNQSYLTSEHTLRGPVGPLGVPITLLPDLNITETDTAVVDAYTALETVEKMYDSADGYKFNNLTLPTLLETPFRRSGDTLTTDYSLLFDNFSSVPNNMFLNLGTTMTVNVGTEEDTPIVSGSYVVTGASLPTSVNPTINLDGRSVSGNVRVGTGGITVHVSILNVRQFTSPVAEADRATQYTIGGTVDGHIQIDVPNASDTVYLYFTETSGHAVRIDKTGNGTLEVGGPTAGAFGSASTDGTGTITSGGITLAPATGTARFEPTPPVNRTLNFSALPAGSRVAIFSGLSSTTPVTNGAFSVDDRTTYTVGSIAGPGVDLVNSDLGSSTVSYVVMVSHQTVPRQYIRYDFTAANATGTTTVSGFSNEDANVNTTIAIPTDTNGDPLYSITSGATLSSGDQVLTTVGFDDVYVTEGATAAAITQVRNQANHLLSGRFIAGTISTGAEVWVNNDPFQGISAGVNVRVDNDSATWTNGGGSNGQQELRGVVPTRTVEGARFTPYAEGTLEEELVTTTQTNGVRQVRAVPPRIGGYNDTDRSRDNRDSIRLAGLL